jgi:hypothetical protein
LVPIVHGLRRRGLLIVWIAVIAKAVSFLLVAPRVTAAIAAFVAAAAAALATLITAT